MRAFWRTGFFFTLRALFRGNQCAKDRPAERVATGPESVRFTRKAKVDLPACAVGASLEMQVRVRLATWTGRHRRPLFDSSVLYAKSRVALAA